MLRNRSKSPLCFTLTQLQIVVGGMLGGLLVFLGLAIFLVHSGAVSEAGDYLAFLIHVAIGLAVVASVAQVVFLPRGLAATRQRVVRRQPNLDDAESASEARRSLWQYYCGTTVISAALLEGAAFFCLVTYMMTASLVPLAMAAALTAGIVAKMPTRRQADGWLEEQFDLVRQDAQLA